MSRVSIYRGVGLLVLLALTFLAPLSTVVSAQTVPSTAATAQTSSKLVLAYYLLAYPTYDDTVEGYKQDIRDAQALGIDGFALNAGSWSVETYFQTRSAKMFQAALELGTGFKLFMSADLCCALPAADVVDMYARYANHPNQLRYNGSPVFTAWMGEAYGQDFWQNQVLGKLTAYNPLFVPYFYTNHNNADWMNPATANWNNPTYAEVSANYNGWWASVVGGLHYYVAPGLAEEHAATNEAISQLMRANGKVFMAGITPYFWQGRLNPRDPGLLRRYYETHGGEGIAVQWNSIINTQQADIVMLDTWNDFGESYLTSADPSLMTLKQWFYNSGPLLKSHAGYAELMKFYIQWFKSGNQPAIATDAIYYFYRTHSKDLTAPQDTQNVILYGEGYTSQPLPSTAVPTYGEVFDNIYVTTVLTAPATLTVTSGGIVTSVAVPAGIQHSRVPFTAGDQSFELTRNGTPIVRKNGDPIDATITAYNFTTTSGFGYGSPTAPPVNTPPTAPANLAGRAVSATQIDLAWSASTDDVGVAGYVVYRNGTEIGTSLTTSYSDTGLGAGTTYAYSVAAYDAEGAISPPAGVSVSTQAAPAPAFAVGVRVTTTVEANVRSKPRPGGKLVGIQDAGSLGRIVAGPNQDGGYTWWQVNFDSGRDGWVTQNSLATTLTP